MFRLREYRKLIALCLFIPVAFIFLFNSLESYSYQWSNRNEAVASKNGFLPQNIPNSARNIFLHFNIDTNERWSAFSFDTSEEYILLAPCQSVSVENVTLPREPKGVLFSSITWWPPVLTDSSSSILSEYSFFRCEESPRLPDSRELSSIWVGRKGDMVYMWGSK